jgi:biopolymer transport protein ExbD
MADPTNLDSTGPENSESLGDGSAPFAGWPADVGDGQPQRKKRKKRRAAVAGSTLTLNSLMDIVTILLVYLLKSYATSPIEVKDPSVELPTSNSKENVEEATVVMITGPQRVVANPNNPSQTMVVPVTPTIVLDGASVLSLDPNTYRIPEDLKDPSTGGYVINALRQGLRQAKEMQALTAASADTVGESGRVVIIADKNTPYRVLTDVLVTCGSAGFGEFKFAIVKEDG